METQNNFLAQLEDKVEEIIKRVSQLQEENRLLKIRLDEALALQAIVEVKEKEVNELSELLAVQDAEREEIRKRVEALVSKLEPPKD